jgi:hypothetical protein
MTASTDVQGNRRGARVTRLLSIALLPAAFAIGGCSGNAVLICDEVCDCEDCSDREYDDCVNDYEAQIDTADVYGCIDDADAYWECAIEHYDCIDRHWTPGGQCASDGDDLNHCLDGRSDIYHNPGVD